MVQQGLLDKAKIQSCSIRNLALFLNSVFEIDDDIWYITGNGICISVEFVIFLKALNRCLCHCLYTRHSTGHSPEMTPFDFPLNSLRIFVMLLIHINLPYAHSPYHQIRDIWNMPVVIFDWYWYLHLNLIMVFTHHLNYNHKFTYNLCIHIKIKPYTYIKFIFSV